MDRINLAITAFVATAILVHVSIFTSSIYAEKCDQKNDPKCDGSKTSNNEKKCEAKNKDKNKDNDNSDVNVQNSNVENTGDQCTGIETNNNLLGEGPYSFPTDTFSLPT
jgi:hypothetical protein